MAPYRSACSVLSATFLALSITFFISAHGIQPTDSDSPAWEAVNHHWETFQNGFSEKSIYRGQPTQELEEAWNATLLEHPFVIPAAQIEPVDGNHQGLVKSADGGIVAHLELSRNLACLNLLRQHTYREDYNYLHLAAFRGSEGEIMARVDGCIQRLRQVLMCSGDATPYLIMLTPEKKQKESPDFNTLHYSLESFANRDGGEIYHQIRLNGTPDVRSAFRGPPSPEVDQSWARYWRTWIFSVDEETFLASLPEHPDAGVRLADGRYMATFEATISYTRTSPPYFMGMACPKLLLNSVPEPKTDKNTISGSINYSYCVYPTLERGLYLYSSSYPDLPFPTRRSGCLATVLEASPVLPRQWPLRCSAAHFVSIYLGAYEPGRKVSRDPQWVPVIKETHHRRFDTLSGQALDWCHETWRMLNIFWWGDLHNKYDVHLWTIPTEFRCSLAVFLVLPVYVTVRRHRIRRFIMSILMFYSYVLDRWDVALFFSGLLIADTSISEEPSMKPSVSSNTFRYRLSQAIRITMFGFSLVLLSALDFCMGDTPGFILLSRMIPRSDPIISTAFNSSIAQYLGRVSYSIYIVHGPLIHTVGYAVFPFFWSITGMEQTWSVVKFDIV
ncbi:hypothetical protein SUNI508_10344 [Seiridium unicorne]|uniref:Acyltransferase 3 domain-containing protein n=1 Tax=Seiridium unicorne TaxID=138068 RepID=A0ABR2ULI6_9PEZI